MPDNDSVVTRLDCDWTKINACLFSAAMYLSAAQEKTIKLMTWPQFVCVLRKLGLDPDNFHQNWAPAERVPMFERQLEIQALREEPPVTTEAMQTRVSAAVRQCLDGEGPAPVRPPLTPARPPATLPTPPAGLSYPREVLTAALVHAYYTPAELNRMVSFDLNESLDNIAAPGPLTQRALDLILWAESEGRLDELFTKALRRKPGNPKLKELAAKLKATHEQLLDQFPPPPAAQLGHAATAAALEAWNVDLSRAAATLPRDDDSLQALVWGASGLSTGVDVDDWQAAMSRSRRFVCLVRAGGMLGTGFLVSPRHIMTNSHVIPTDVMTSQHQVTFDYTKTAADLSTLPAIPIEAVIHRSKVREFDYVIARLAHSPPGDRGFAQPHAHPFAPREPVLILQHPGGGPMRFEPGVVADFNSLFGRVAYTANTEKGSSGSPVFDRNWRVVALHHQGDPGFSNHGSAMQAILGERPDLFSSLSA